MLLYEQLTDLTTKPSLTIKLARTSSLVASPLEDLALVDDCGNPLLILVSLDS
jgi:hypothetical protein